MKVNDPHFSNHSWIAKLRNKLFPQKDYRVSPSAPASAEHTRPSIPSHPAVETQKWWSGQAAGTIAPWADPLSGQASSFVWPMQEPLRSNPSQVHATPPSSRPGTPFGIPHGRSETPSPELTPYQRQYDVRQYGAGIAPQWRSGTPFGPLQSPLRGMDSPSVRYVPEVALSAESALLSAARSSPWTPRDPLPRNPYQPSGELPRIHSAPPSVDGSSVARPNAQRAALGTAQFSPDPSSTTAPRALPTSDSPSAFGRPRVSTPIAPRTGRALGGG